MSRPRNRSSMVDICYFLQRLRQRNKKSIYILRRIEQMRSDANSTLTQRDHKPLVPQRLLYCFCITAAGRFDATKYPALRGLPWTRQPIALRESLEEIAN